MTSDRQTDGRTDGQAEKNGATPTFVIHGFYILYPKMLVSDHVHFRLNQMAIQMPSRKRTGTYEI